MIDLPEAELIQIEREAAHYDPFHAAQTRRFIAALRETRSALAELSAGVREAVVTLAAQRAEIGAVRAELTEMRIRFDNADTVSLALAEVLEKR
jgi:hypothetical protein